MMSSEVPGAQPRPPRPPLRVGLTVLHLVALGTLGWVVLAVAASLLGVGLALLVVLGIGVVFLVALVYTLFGVAWCETERVADLYALDVPRLSAVRQQRPGFGGVMRMLGMQAIDGRMWQGLASFTVAGVLGLLTVACLQNVVWGASAFGVSLAGRSVEYHPSLGSFMSPLLRELPAWAYLAIALAALAATVGLALVHRLVTVWIVRAGADAARLTAAAERSELAREGAVRAADVERTRLERDLHDGVQPRLVSVGMTLGLAQQQLDSDPAAAKALIAEAHTSTKAAITELRQLARGIHPSVLEDRGLDAALSALAGRSHIPVALDVRLDGRCSRDAETAVYFVIAESLTNAAKHSRASEVRVIVRLREQGTLWARVEDNGAGGARVVPGGGLDGIMHRVAAAGGTVRLDSPLGGPTSLEVSVPCAS